MKTGVRICLFAACAFTKVATAQQAAEEFEVATIKPAATREINGIAVYAGGRLAARGCTVHTLIERAFHVQSFQVSGGPGWIDDSRYDIDAQPTPSAKWKAYAPPNRRWPLNEDQRALLQSLLKQRFQLKCHREAREGPVYLLLRGKGPLKLVEPQDKNRYPWAGGLMGGAIMGDGLMGINISMADLGFWISWYLQRPVLDRTGIPNSFDFRYEYMAAAGGERADSVTVILAAMKAIGLKLQASRGPVETIVVDSAAKPSPN